MLPQSGKLCPLYGDGSEVDRSMTPYSASHTGKITEEDALDSTLVTHEAAGDRPLCGTPLRPWRGKRMVFRLKGRAR